MLVTHEIRNEHVIFKSYAITMGEFHGFTNTIRFFIVNLPAYIIASFWIAVLLITQLKFTFGISYSTRTKEKIRKTQEILTKTTLKSSMGMHYLIPHQNLETNKKNTYNLITKNPKKRTRKLLFLWKIPYLPLKFRSWVANF